MGKDKLGKNAENRIIERIKQHRGKMMLAWWASVPVNQMSKHVRCVPS